MFSISETVEENTVEDDNWRKRPRSHIDWKNTYLIEFLVSKYPEFQPTNAELQMLEQNIPEATPGQLKDFFFNYGRIGKNERFKSIKQKVKDLASSEKTEEKIEISGMIEDNNEDMIPSTECRMEYTEDFPVDVAAEVTIESTEVNMETTEADVSTGTDDTTENTQELLQ